MGLTKYSSTPQDLEFVKALNLSHGKGNNSVIASLIYEHNCTAEDVERVANKTNNEHTFEQVMGRYSQKGYAVERILNKTQYCGKGNKYLTFRDYKWYFNNIDDKYIDWYLPNLLTMPELLGDKTKLSDNALAMYFWKCEQDILKANYPSDFFADRLKANEELYERLTKPYDFKNLAVSYDCRQVMVHRFGTRYTEPEHYMDFFYHDYDRTDGSTTLTKSVQQKVLEQLAQVDILCATMDNEVYTQEELKENVHNGKRLISFADYLFSRYRNTGASKYNHPQKVRLEMFAQAKALEMALAMGLGFRVKSNSSYDLKCSNKKLVKRIQTAYKTFVKAKTVDERKNMRALLKDQLTVLANDFMRHNLEVVELDCVEKQDEMFEQGGAPKSVHLTKAAPVANNAPVVSRKVDLSLLVGAKTVTVEKGRQ